MPLGEKRVSLFELRAGQWVFCKVYVCCVIIHEAMENSTVFPRCSVNSGRKNSPKKLFHMLLWISRTVTVVVKFEVA